MQALIPVLAVVIGIALGFWLRSSSGKAEKVQFEQRNREATEALAAAQAQLARAQAESATRAGFESVAAERQNTIDRLTAERDAAQSDLRAAGIYGRQPLFCSSRFVKPSSL